MPKLPMSSEVQMRRFQPFIPMQRGLRRVNDRRVINSIGYVIHYGLQWQDAPPGLRFFKTL